MPITPHETICSNDTNKSHLYGVCCRFHLDDLADEFTNAMSDSRVNENRRGELHAAFLQSGCYLEITVVMWKAVTRSGMCRHYRGVSSSRLLQESGIVTEDKGVIN